MKSRPVRQKRIGGNKRGSNSKSLVAKIGRHAKTGPDSPGIHRNCHSGDSCTMAKTPLAANLGRLAHLPEAALLLHIIQSQSDGLTPHHCMNVTAEPKLSAFADQSCALRMPFLRARPNSAGSPEVCYLRAFFERMATVLKCQTIIGTERWQPLKSSFADMVGEIRITDRIQKWPAKSLPPLDVTLLAFMDEAACQIVTKCKLPNHTRVPSNKKHLPEPPGVHYGDYQRFCIDLSAGNDASQFI